MKKYIFISLASFCFIILFFGCGDKTNQKGSDSTQDLHIAGQDNLNETTVEPKVTFVELGSNECIPCKMMKSVMKAIEDEFGNQVKVVFHDVWEDQAPADQYEIRMIPTQVFLDESGEEFFRHEGFFPKEEIETLLVNKGLTLLKTVDIEEKEEK